MPLHIAAQKNFFLIVETLLDAGADIEGINLRVCFHFVKIYYVKLNFHS